MVALGKQQLDDQLAELEQLRRMRRDLHALLRLCHAGRQKLAAALDFDNTQSARADCFEPVKMAEGWDFNSILACHLEYGLMFGCTNFLAVYCERLDLVLISLRHLSLSSLLRRGG